jgi:hypothetical protein
MRLGRPTPRPLGIGGLPLLADGGSIGAEAQALLQAAQAMKELEQKIVEMMVILLQG